MNKEWLKSAVRAISLWVVMVLLWSVAAAASLTEQNERMLSELQRVHRLSDQQMQKLRAIFARSGFAGQGNPTISEHPLTPEQCEAKLAQQSVSYANDEFERICHSKYMAPLYDPTSQRDNEVKTCIDQFEYTDIT